MVVASLAPGDVSSRSRGPKAPAPSRSRVSASASGSIVRGGATRSWIGHALRLDFGTSFRYGQPVLSLVAARAAHSALLAGTALPLAIVVGVPLGLLSGSGRFPRLSAVVARLSLVLFSLPPLLVALVLTVIAVRTGWAPAGGMQSAGADEWDAGSRVLDLAPT